MTIFFVGIGAVMHQPVFRSQFGLPIIPRVGEKVRLQRVVYVVDDVQHDYDTREIRVYLITT